MAKAWKTLNYLTGIPSQCSFIEPCRRLYQSLGRIEQQQGLRLSFTPGFPMADFAECGMDLAQAAPGPDLSSSGTGIEDAECERFNKESEELFKFKYANPIVNNRNIFRCLEKNQKIETGKLQSTANKKICFTRFAESLDENKKAQIIIMNETIFIPEKYTHQFVFVEWDLEKEQLSIYSEYQKVKTFIKKVKFKINNF